MLTSLMCVAVAIYFESRGEPVAGQVAVAHVIRNRMEDPRYQTMRVMWLSKATTGRGFLSGTSASLVFTVTG